MTKMGKIKVEEKIMSMYSIRPLLTPEQIKVKREKLGIGDGGSIRLYGEKFQQPILDVFFLRLNQAREKYLNDGGFQQ